MRLGERPDEVVGEEITEGRGREGGGGTKGTPELIRNSRRGWNKGMRLEGSRLEASQFGM